MTNKEAAEFIWDVLDGVKSFNEEGGRGLEALDLAIKALKNEKAKESEIIKAYTKGFDTGVETVKNERPQGEWKYVQYDGNANIGNWHCSECGRVVFDHIRYVYRSYSKKPYYNFCPICGAKMKKDGVV